MINAITTKIEMDIMQANELMAACQLASSHSMPAVVVHQALTQQAYLMRGRFNAKFKIITPVDWPKGEIFGMNKLRGLTLANLQVDGFEIMLTGGKTEAETKNEANVISKFIRDHVSPIAEIRFVLGCYTRPEADVLKMCKVMKDVPTPALLRTDHHLKAQATKANQKAQLALIKTLRQATQCPLKISGNIDSVRTVTECIGATDGNNASRCAVSLQQAQAIIRDLQKQPDLRKLLETKS